ncbi:MAG: uroporphyrinogen decarboxylase [Longimicrobiales bacterium]|nr:uroporphyrinogen decarboxylase [Longimicrobiales bacterium]
MSAASTSHDDGRGGSGTGGGTESAVPGRTLEPDDLRRPDAPYLRACLGLETPQVPMWVMRQAGRYLPEYRALKEDYDFLTLSQTPELLVEVTLQPLRRFPMDAAIVFADIMTPLHSMGFEIDFAPGPVIQNPFRGPGSVPSLREPEPDEIAPFLAEGLRALAGELPPHQALIGFSGAPFTLFCYVVEGGGSKDFMSARTLLRAEPEAAQTLLSALAETQVHYLRMQHEAGADALMVFDSWVGLLSEADYRRFAMPHVRRVLQGLADIPAPVTYFPFGGGHLLEAVSELQADVVGIDWRTPLSEASRRLGGDKVVQGNLNPAALFAEPDELRQEAAAVLQEGDRAHGHVFNLGHGIDRRTDPDQVARLVDFVHGWAR